MMRGIALRGQGMKRFANKPLKTKAKTTTATTTKATMGKKKKESTEKESEVAKVKRLGAEMESSKKYLNNLVTLLQVLQGSKSESAILVSLKIIEKFFTNSFRNGDFDKKTIEKLGAKDARVVLFHWINEQYSLFKVLLLGLISNTDTEAAIQVLALKSILNIIRLREKTSYTTLFRNIIFSIITSPNFSMLLETLQTYLDDINFIWNTLRSLKELLEQERLSIPQYSENILQLLLLPELVPSRRRRNHKRKFSEEDDESNEDENEEEGGDEEEEENDNDSVEENQSENETDEEDIPKEHVRKHRAHFSKCWIEFLSKTHPDSLYKKIFPLMDSVILPNLTQPFLLMDFLIKAYDAGGEISLLALEGLFYMITEHNLDYPQFYEKLYLLFTPQIFHLKKYGDKFITLSSLFLSSEFLSTHLVAAFVKKLGRLAFLVPVEGCMIIVGWIFNLLKRHVACRSLIHKQKVKSQVLLINSTSEMSGEDSYNFEEPDPTKSNAFKSSLWEITALESHYCPAVSKLAKIFSNPNFDERPYFDLKEFMQTRYEKLFDEESKFKGDQVPLAFIPKPALFTPDEHYQDCWVIKK